MLYYDVYYFFLLLGLHIVLTVLIKRIMLCYVTVTSFIFNSHCRTRRDAKKTDLSRRVGRCGCWSLLDCRLTVCCVRLGRSMWRCGGCNGAGKTTWTATDDHILLLWSHRNNSSHAANCNLSTTYVYTAMIENHKNFMELPRNWWSWRSDTLRGLGSAVR